jgi:hypothetical protein
LCRQRDIDRAERGDEAQRDALLDREHVHALASSRTANRATSGRGACEVAGKGAVGAEGAPAETLRKRNADDLRLPRSRAGQEWSRSPAGWNVGPHECRSADATGSCTAQQRRQSIR